MQAKIQGNFKGLFKAFRRVYDGIMLSLNSLKKGLIKSPKKALYF